MLDLDLTLDALMADPVNVSHLYAVKLKANQAKHIQFSGKANGHTLDSKYSDLTAMKMADCLHPDKVNGSKIDSCCTELPTTVRETDLTAAKHLHAASSGLSEEKLRERFGHFGAVESIFLPSKPFGKRARHAYISE